MDSSATWNTDTYDMKKHGKQHHRQKTLRFGVTYKLTKKQLIGTVTIKKPISNKTLNQSSRALHTHMILV
jgi:hypothetical protein